MTLKCAGRRHDPEGVGNTPPGSLTVECPACPHPDQNLPENWREAGPLMYKMFWIFTLKISYDLQSGFFISCIFLLM